MNALRVIAPELPFELKFIEIKGAEETFELHGYRLEAFKVNHNVLCYGYTLEIDRAGRFDAGAEPRQPDIPLKLLESACRKVNTVEIDGVVYTPDMVLGPPRKGIKLTYTTDTTPSALHCGKCSRTLICLSVKACMGKKRRHAKAVEYKHMTFL